MIPKDVAKKLYSFYIDPDVLENLDKLSKYASTKGKKITVSKLIRFAVQKFVIRETKTVELIDNLVNEIDSMNMTEDD